MLEGDELFENANETAYKICSSIESDSNYVAWNRCFSAQWDPNYKDTIALCSQNGQIRMISVANGLYKTFTVQFRRFVTSIHAENSQGRVLSYHFDKMSMIPQRPGEFLFLLGVSKSVMYSAVPGYSRCEIAQSARPGSSQFSHGCSVFELYSHDSRVTSLAVSNTGNFLATGDEKGILKITTLFLFAADRPYDNALGGGKQQNQTSSASGKTKEPIFTESLKATIKAHGSTVYSLHWLPQMYGQKKKRTMTLVTGSDDRIVRLWRVENSKEQLQVSPLILLSTMSSCILSISSCFCAGPVADRYQDPRAADVSQYLSIDQLMVSGLPKSSTFSGVGHSQGVNNSNKALVHQGSSTVIAAGTSSGAVYVWRLDAADLNGVLAPNKLKNILASDGSRDAVRDDGSRLLSLIFASENPVVHASSTFCFESPSQRGKLVLAVSDIVGSLKMHTELHADDDADANANADANSDADADAPRKQKLVGGSGTRVANNPNFSPLVFSKEFKFSNPIVACAFRREKELEIGQDSPDEKASFATTSPENYYSLLTCLASGEMNYIACGTSSGAGAGSGSSGSSGSSGTSEVFRVISIGGPNSAKGEDEAGREEGGNGTKKTEKEEEEEADSYNNLMNYFEKVNKQMDTQYPKLNDISINTKPSSRKNEPDTYSSNIKSDFKTNLNNKTIVDPNDNVNYDRYANDDGDVDEPVPRTNPLPVPCPPSPIVDSKNRAKSPLLQRFLRAKSPEVNRAQSNQGGGLENEIEKSNKKLFNDTDECGDEPESIIVPNPAPVPFPQTALRSPLKKHVGEVGLLGKKEEEKIYKSPKGVTEAVEAVEADTSAVRNTKSQDQSQAPDNNIHIPLYGNESYPVGTSPHAVPVLHSSKLLSMTLRKIDEKLENDQISISTIETTSTLRLKATQRAVNMGARSNLYNYAELTPIDDKEASKRMPKKLKVPKQVDKAWLARKQNFGPMQEDTKILYTPDPIVNLKFSYGSLDKFSQSTHPSTNPTPAKLSLSELSGGLISIIDADSLLPSYDLMIDPDKVFGSLINNPNKNSSQPYEITALKDEHYWDATLDSIANLYP